MAVHVFILKCGAAGVLVSMCFNITTVLCSTPSQSQRSYRMEKVLVTSSPSDRWARSPGPGQWYPHPSCRAMFSVMTPYHRSRPLLSKWVLLITVVKDPSAPSSRCSQQRKVSLIPGYGHNVHTTINLQSLSLIKLILYVEIFKIISQVSAPWITPSRRSSGALHSQTHPPLAVCLTHRHDLE